MGLLTLILIISTSILAGTLLSFLIRNSFKNQIDKLLSKIKQTDTIEAMLHNQTKNYDKAIEMAILAIEKKPDDAEAYFQLAISYSLKETPEVGKAYTYFRKAAELDPKKEPLSENNIGSNWAKHFNLGVSEYQSGNLQDAANEFDQAILADPRKVKSWLNLAMVYNRIAIDDSTYKEALYTATETLMGLIETGDPDYGKVLALAGRVMIMRDNETKAIEIFERLLTDHPTHAEEIERVGNDFLRQKNFASAARMFEIAAKGYIETETENPDLYYNMGVCYLRTDQFLRAAEAYQQVLTYQPDNVRAYYSRLLSYYQGKYWNEAIMFGQEYTDTVAPEDPRGWQLLSLSLKKTGKNLDAEIAVKKYFSLIEDDTS